MPTLNEVLALLEQATAQTATGRASFVELRQLHEAITRALDGAVAAFRAGDSQTVRARFDLLAGLLTKAIAVRARAGTAFARGDSATRAAAEQLRAIATAQ